eukprot:CAMPEP_0183741440 /NCGR_PEP_ID=MMETSP0737-20130205/62141_1 /TAXON_ID=385413 /ORGANISM="Thalassiosira miniscula, Strain CCMP1093" /LENGTH=438 /DNA_ID=CAMNT_0025976767 /DNA_START=26 /DNA_END=1339 /DNA_ORIENTATION=+
MTKLLRSVSFLLYATVRVQSNDNGLAQTPPMGWRSWNQFGQNVNQSLMISIMHSMVHRGRVDHNGIPTSLCDLGYCDAGLDDNWQACHSPLAAPGMNYHDVNGYPIVNTSSFPDLRIMVDTAHSLGLKAGFYGNNCICSDNCRNETECEMQISADVDAFINWGFDSWKLDGCGGENNLTLFDTYLRERLPDKPILVENCHWGEEAYDPDPSLPPREGCPFNFYRSGGDNQPNYEAILGELAMLEKYRARNMSIPGCWAYPDMLEVGVRLDDANKTIALSQAESRSHFGAWCVVSSPLFLTHDLRDEDVNDHIWSIISNREAIAVNQAYAGDSGGVYEQVPPPVETNTENYMEMKSSGATSSILRRRILGDFNNFNTISQLPSYQYLSKPLGGGKVAILLMNTFTESQMLEATFEDVPGLSTCENGYMVRNVWTHTDEG